MGIPTIFEIQFLKQSLNQLDCNDSDGLIEKKKVEQEDKNIVRELIASLERIAKIRTDSIEPDKEEEVTSQQDKGRRQMLSRLGANVPKVIVKEQGKLPDEPIIQEQHEGSEREEH